MISIMGRRESRCLTVLVFLLATLAAPSAKAQSMTSAPQITVSFPVCTNPGETPTNSSNGQASVLANVTYTGLITNLNVTFHYAPINQSNPASYQNRNNVTNDQVINMYNQNYSKGDYEFETVQPIPAQDQDITVFGYVQAYDKLTDNLTYSNEYLQPLPVATCTYYSPKPVAELDLALDVEDVNPRYLNLSITAKAALTNSISYRGTVFVDSSSDTNLDVLNGQQEGFFSWSYTGNVTSGIYATGISQLFPVDSYNYQIMFTPQLELNITMIKLNNVGLVPGQSILGLIGFVGNPTQAQTDDDSPWTITSSAMFTPMANGHLATLTIDIHLTRKLSEVEYPILIPLISIYALLGVSLLAVRKDDLANRLLIYISIFIFSYEFLNYVSSLIVSPVGSGANMLELLILALIPCTAILAGASFVRWISTINRNPLGADLVDLIGIILATLALVLIANFTIPTYSSSAINHISSRSYTLAALGPFGYVLLASFASGSLYPLGRMASRIRWVKNKTSNLSWKVQVRHRLWSHFLVEIRNRLKKTGTSWKRRLYHKSYDKTEDN
jgi:hypothetical protein